MSEEGGDYDYGYGDGGGEPPDPNHAENERQRNIKLRKMFGPIAVIIFLLQVTSVVEIIGIGNKVSLIEDQKFILKDLNGK